MYACICSIRVSPEFNFIFNTLRLLLRKLLVKILNHFMKWKVFVRTFISSEMKVIKFLAHDSYTDSSKTLRQ